MTSKRVSNIAHHDVFATYEVHILVPRFSDDDNKVDETANALEDVNVPANVYHFLRQLLNSRPDLANASIVVGTIEGVDP